MATLKIVELFRAIPPLLLLAGCATYHGGVTFHFLSQPDAPQKFSQVYDALVDSGLDCSPADLKNLSAHCRSDTFPTKGIDRVTLYQSGQEIIASFEYEGAYVIVAQTPAYDMAFVEEIRSLVENFRDLGASYVNFVPFPYENVGSEVRIEINDFDPVILLKDALSDE
ncbi:MAG: hypothetical protein MUQ84_06465 [Loktanella sp.]|nr:hypothetical protein [Loktanella sp.]